MRVKQNVCNESKPIDAELMKKIVNFVNLTTEELTIMEHQNCLSLVPISKTDLMSTFLHYNPIVCDQNQPKERRSVTFSENLDRTYVYEQVSIPGSEDSNSTESDSSGDRDYKSTGIIEAFYGRSLNKNRRRGRPKKLQEIELQHQEVNPLELSNDKKPKRKRGRPPKITEPLTDLSEEEITKNQRNRKRKILELKQEVDDQVTSSISIAPYQQPTELKVGPMERNDSDSDWKNGLQLKKRGRKRKIPETNAENTLTPEKKKPGRKSKSHEMVAGKTERAPDEYPRSCELTESERNWLLEQIRLSKKSERAYHCLECHKVLSSYPSIRYHLIARHLAPRDPRKEWIRSKVKEGQKVVEDDSGPAIMWNCLQCSRVFTSQSALRYHLKAHLRSDSEAEGGEMSLADEEEKLSPKVQIKLGKNLQASPPLNVKQERDCTKLV